MAFLTYLPCSLPSSWWRDGSSSPIPATTTQVAFLLPFGPDLTAFGKDGWLSPGTCRSYTTAVSSPRPSGQLGLLCLTFWFRSLISPPAAMLCSLVPNPKLDHAPCHYHSTWFPLWNCFCKPLWRWRRRILPYRNACVIPSPNLPCMRRLFWLILVGRSSPIALTDPLTTDPRVGTLPLQAEITYLPLYCGFLPTLGWKEGRKGCVHCSFPVVLVHMRHIAFGTPAWTGTVAPD